MDKKYKAIGGSVIGVAIISTLLLTGVIDLTDNTMFCVDDNTFCEANYGVSGGLHTRCYSTQEEKDNWRTAPLCSSGWIQAKDYVVEETTTTQTTTTIKQPNKVIIDNKGKIFKGTKDQPLTPGDFI